MILQQPTDRHLSKEEKAIKDLFNTIHVKDVSLSAWRLQITFDNDSSLVIDIDQINWSRYELRVEVS